MTKKAKRTHGLDCGCDFDCDCEYYDPEIHVNDVAEDGGQLTHGIDCGCGFNCECEYYDPEIHGPIYDEDGIPYKSTVMEGEEWKSGINYEE